MKTVNLSAKVSLFFISLFIISLVSCKCKPVVEKNTSEYIHYTVNGASYGYDMPTDSVYADTIKESMPFDPSSWVVGSRIPLTPTSTTKIDYSPFDVSIGSQQQLRMFASPQTEIYPHYASSANQIFVTITEYGNIGEFISGNFNGLITGSAPGNQQYHITCEFRVKRRI